MFHQIKVIKEDQVAQKFLWRQGDTSREPDVYVMSVMTFGASCSPSLANYVKNLNAQQYAGRYPDAVRAILENTFVDDWLHSSDSEEELARLAPTVRWIHKEGGFEMRNWVSNSRAVLNTLDTDPEMVARCFDEPEAVMEKVLGMCWLPGSDELTFIERFPSTLSKESTIPSKRQILRTLMTIFDPLGLLGFLIVQAKIILQEVWRSGVSWDEPVLEEQGAKWKQWVTRVPAIRNIKIPRHFQLANISRNNELHVFVDASINAYAAVAYLRSESGGQVRCSLLASKTRVAPLKPISVPRLELMAAILGLRLAKFIAKEFSIKVTRRSFWTDSRNVLYWLHSDARKFHQFVALRIGEILEDSNATEWRWLPSHENVADEGTKWNENCEIKNDQRWFRGPHFLSNPKSDWPISDFLHNDGEAIESVHLIDSDSAKASSISSIIPDIQRFSKWEKLRNTQRVVLRFLRTVGGDRLHSQQLQQILKEDTIDAAEKTIMLFCQEEAFREETQRLSRGEELHRKSQIFKWSPYMDEMGLLRVKGRIDAVEGVAVNVKRPIILPRHHNVTRLIIDFYHRRFHHHHNEIIVNEMRQRFCVAALRSLVRECAAKCQTCRNRRARPCPPQMGNLPPERVSPFTRPFTFTGVDYFGPIDIAVGRKREKRWGALFTCLTTRAVHIEITPSLSTESFLLVLKQFVSRRGVPHRIISDNGTNFRGASRVLANEIERISSSSVASAHPEIEWAFIPPSAPHMGGAWERMIRSTKSILMDILPNTAVREKVLRAALADIENILNSRPLTYVPLETAESEALTPNHFLLGSSSGIRESRCSDSSGESLGRFFRISSQLADQFWRRWVREYLPCLTRRTKWFQPPPKPIELGDVVIIVDEQASRNSWPKGIVIDLHRDKDGQARSAVVKTSASLCTRPIIKLAKLDVRPPN